MSDTAPSVGRRAAATPPGRRGLAGRRVDALVVLALVLPAATGAAFAVNRADDPAPPAAAPPTSARLTDASLVCAAGSSRAAGPVQLSRVPDVDGGEVVVRVSPKRAGAKAALRERGERSVRPGRLTSVAAAGDVAVTGRGTGAPGLVAGRTGPARAVAECRPPTYDEWYVGIGAAARQSSTIELANPDEGPAIVEIAVYGRYGPEPLDVPDLRGIRVPGRQVVRLDLSAKTPRRGTLAAHVLVVRGRVTTTVRHTFDPLGRDLPRVDFLPAQALPSTSNLLLGVPARTDGVIHLFNPGEDETRATVRVVSDSAVFTPAGLDEVAVPAGSVRQVSLSKVLTRKAAEGAVGLEVVSPEPLVASVRVLGDDLGLIGPSVAFDAGERVSAVVPAGPKALVLGGAERTGTVRVTAYDDRGKRLLDGKRVGVGADRGRRVRLPEAAALLVVEARNTAVAGTVVLTGDRLGALRLRPAQVDADVPAVRPG